jgi:hypothetical protein
LLAVSFIDWLDGCRAITINFATQFCAKKPSIPPQPPEHRERSQRR